MAGRGRGGEGTVSVPAGPAGVRGGGSRGRERGGEAGGGGRAGRARSRESRARARRLAARRGRSIAAASRVSFPGGRSWRRWGKLRGTRGLAVAPDPLARSLPPLGPPPRPPVPASFGAFFSTVVHPSSTMARRADGRSNDSPAGARRGGLFVLLARAPTRTREGRCLAGARARAGRGVYALPNARGGDDQPRSTEHGSGERRALENESRRSIAEEKKEVEREDSGMSGVCARLSARFAVFQWAGASRRRHRSHLMMMNASSRGRAAEPGGAGAHAAMPTTPKRGTATVPDSYESPAPRCVRARPHDPEPRSRSSPRRGLARLGRPRTPFFRDR